MSDLMDFIVDFIRVRQLNIALAGILTFGYLVYQYWAISKDTEEDFEDENPSKSSRARSRSRSLSKSKVRNYSDYNSKRRGGSRRGRRRYSDYVS